MRLITHSLTLSSISPPSDRGAAEMAVDIDYPTPFSNNPPLHDDLLYDIWISFSPVLPNGTEIAFEVNGYHLSSTYTSSGRRWHLGNRLFSVSSNAKRSYR